MFVKYFFVNKIEKMIHDPYYKLYLLQELLDNVYISLETLNTISLFWKRNIEFY